jgi:TolB-like protein
VKIFDELKRRNVFRVSIAYLVGAWVLAQAADFVFQVVGAPDVMLRYLAILLVLGFIPTVIISWVYEVTPEGVRKASEIDPDRSITHETGKKLDMVTIALVVLAIGIVVVERFIPREGADEPAVVAIPVEESSQRITEESSKPSTSIAVLPFANRSNKDDDLYFTDGVHDDLLTQLAKIHNLTVISRTSVMKYRDSTQTLGEIGAALKVGTILEGGVQKVGDRVRINAQLIEVSTDRHLWAETFDRELTAENVFELQSEIARKIVRAVAVQLSPEEEQLLAEVPTQNLAAYDAYLRARDIFYGANYARSQEEEALPLLLRAVELDPNYVDALVLLANIYAQQYWRGIDTSDELLQKYRQTLELVTTLNPGSPGALRAWANYHYRVENDYRRSLELLEQALAVAPGNVDIRGDIGLSLRRLGRWDESIAHFQQALEMDPANGFYRSLMLETLSYVSRWQDILDNSVPLEDADPAELDIQVIRAVALFNMTGDLGHLERVFERMNIVGSSQFTAYSATVHIYKRDYDRAIEVLNDPIWDDINQQQLAATSWKLQLADTWRLKGDHDQANRLYEQTVVNLDEILESSLQTAMFGGGQIAIALARLGRFDEALALAERLVEANPRERDALVVGGPIINRALVRGLAGDTDGALKDLKYILETTTGLGITAWDLYYDPNWDFLRDDPRFVELATPENLIQ